MVARDAFAGALRRCWVHMALSCLLLSCAHGVHATNSSAVPGCLLDASSVHGPGTSLLVPAARCREPGAVVLEQLLESYDGDLYLAGRGIKGIESGAFDGVVVSGSLVLSRNQLGNLERHAFAGLRRVGGDLVLRAAMVTGIAPGALQGLRVDGDVVMTGNRVGRLVTGAFNGVAEIGGTLRLDLAGVTGVDASAFRSLSIGGALVLCGNELGALVRDAFNGVRVKGDLDLSDAGVKRLQPGWLHGATIGGSVRMGGTTLGILPAGCFNGVNGSIGKDLDLRDAGIKGFAPGAMRGVTTGGGVLLDGNALGIVDANTFRGMGRIGGALSLSSAGITGLRPRALAGINIGGDLDVSGNTLAELQAGTFAGVRRIGGRLVLSRAGITRLSPGAFHGLEEVGGDVSADGNDFGVLEAGAFSAGGASTFRIGGTLHLSASGITGIQPGAFRGLEVRNDGHLDLEDNNLGILLAGTFEGMDWGGDNIFSGLLLGRVTGIQAGAFRDVAAASISIPMGASVGVLRAGTFDGIGNTVHCLSLSYAGISGVEPGAFRGCSSVSWLALGSNHVEVLVAGALSGLGPATTLNLDDGRIRRIEPGALPLSHGDVDLTGNPVPYVPEGELLPAKFADLEGAGWDFDKAHCLRRFNGAMADKPSFCESVILRPAVLVRSVLDEAGVATVPQQCLGQLKVQLSLASHRGPTGIALVKEAPWGDTLIEYNVTAGPSARPQHEGVAVVLRETPVSTMAPSFVVEVDASWTTPDATDGLTHGTNLTVRLVAHLNENAGADRTAVPVEIRIRVDATPDNRQVEGACDVYPANVPGRADGSGTTAAGSTGSTVTAMPSPAGNVRARNSAGAGRSAGGVAHTGSPGRREAGDTTHRAADVCYLTAHETYGPVNHRGSASCSANATDRALRPSEDDGVARARAAASAAAEAARRVADAASKAAQDAVTANQTLVQATRTTKEKAKAADDAAAAEEQAIAVAGGCSRAAAMAREDAQAAKNAAADAETRARDMERMYEDIKEQAEARRREAREAQAALTAAKADAEAAKSAGSTLANAAAVAYTEAAMAHAAAAAAAEASDVHAQDAARDMRVAKAAVRESQEAVRAAEAVHARTEREARRAAAAAEAATKARVRAERAATAAYDERRSADLARVGAEAAAKVSGEHADAIAAIAAAAAKNAELGVQGGWLTGTIQAVLTMLAGIGVMLKVCLRCLVPKSGTGALRHARDRASGEGDVDDAGATTGRVGATHTPDTGDGAPTASNADSAGEAGASASLGVDGTAAAAGAAAVIGAGGRSDGGAGAGGWLGRLGSLAASMDAVVNDGAAEAVRAVYADGERTRREVRRTRHEVQSQHEMTRADVGGVQTMVVAAIESE